MKPKVLVVDDEADFVQLIEYNFLREGFEVFSAGNGIEALHQARRLLPDVILLDVMLPDMDGVSVCEILRSQPSTTEIPVVVVSALDGEVVRGRSIEAGVSCRFKKPVDLTLLRDCVRDLCAHKERVRLRKVEHIHEPHADSETSADNGFEPR